MLQDNLVYVVTRLEHGVFRVSTYVEGAQLGTTLTRSPREVLLCLRIFDQLDCELHPGRQVALNTSDRLKLFNQCLRVAKVSHGSNDDGFGIVPTRIG